MPQAATRIKSSVSLWCYYSVRDHGSRLIERCKHTQPLRVTPDNFTIQMRADNNHAPPALSDRLERLKKQQPPKPRARSQAPMSAPPPKRIKADYAEPVAVVTEEEVVGRPVAPLAQHTRNMRRHRMACLVTQVIPDMVRPLCSEILSHLLVR